MYIARKPNYLYGAGIRVDVGYDREIRREGHCYSEREQRGGGGPQEEGTGILSPQHKIQKNVKSTNKTNPKEQPAREKAIEILNKSMLEKLMTLLETG